MHLRSLIGAENEFADAHKEYREGKYKNALTKSLNAFESTIKIICDRQKWKYDSTFSASSLIKVIFDHELLAKSHEGFFCALRCVLESGLPTVRNKNAASHGQGVNIVEVPPHIAGFGLHLAAASIVLLVEASKLLKKM